MDYSANSLLYDAKEILPEGWKLGGHQNFPIRSQWPKKSVVAVGEKADIFKKPEDAMVTFGVGKVMVGVLRHWCRVAEITRPCPEGNQECVTDFGNILFGENGLDPYILDINTAWLLHYKVCTNPQAWVWRWLFNYSDLVSFSLDSAKKRADSQIKMCSHSDKKPPVISSIKRDLDCLVSSYALPVGANRSYEKQPVKKKPTPKKSLEEYADCPFRDLGIIQRTDPKNAKIVRRKRERFSAWLLAWAVIDFAEEKSIGQINIESIISDPLSPGKVFCLDRETVIEKIRLASELTNGLISVVDSAGLQQVHIGKSAFSDPTIRDEYLKNIYE